MFAYVFLYNTVACIQFKEDKIDNAELKDTLKYIQEDLCDIIDMNIIEVKDDEDYMSIYTHIPRLANCLLLETLDDFMECAIWG